MKKERTFSEIITGLLFPFKINPLMYFRGFCMYSIWAFAPIMHVVFLQYIISFIEIGDNKRFVLSITLYGVFIVFHQVLEYIVRKWGWTELVHGTEKIVHRIYVPKFVKLDNNKVETLGTGKIISLLEKGINIWGRLLNMIIQSGTSVVFTLIFAIVMIFKTNFYYGIIFLVIYIILHIFGAYLDTFMVKYRNKRIQSHHNYTKQFIKIIMSKFEVLQSMKAQREIEVLDYYADRAIYFNKRMVPYAHIMFRLPEFFISVTRLFVFIFLGKQVISGEISISLLVGISGALMLMERAIMESVKMYKDITKDSSFVTKMWNFFDETPEIKGYEEGQDFKHTNGDIEIKDLSYGYSDNKFVFDNFSIKIKGGEVTAFVGASGGGKSTLVKLIAGYISSNSGNIIIDNQKLNEVSLKSYYKDIGYLTQEPSVFDGTVLDNLTYAIDRQLEEGELQSILELAKCDFIKDLQEGLNTEIGERGIRLSGGQKQRLAIAKIFLKDPKIIILDEPTSALDSFSEEQITKAMHNLFKGRTVIIIAHRLQTVKNADDIILLEDGKIEERGTHRELVKLKGKYKKMLDLQSGF